MSFFGSLFGEKIQNENKTKPIFECATREQRKDWFARTRPWHKVPAPVINAVISKLESQPPVMVEVFVHTSLKAGLIPHYERMTGVHSDVACSIISGFFVKAGMPLVQQFMTKKQGIVGAASERDIESLTRHASDAKDCLELATVLYEQMISAYAPLALLLAETGEMEQGLKCATRGLAAIRQLRIHSAEFRGSTIESVRNAPEELASMEVHMQQMVNALTQALQEQTG